MNIKNFPVSGYARFYRSIPRFYHGIGDAYAQKFTYALYLAVNKTFRHINPAVTFTEYAEEDFCVLIKQANVKPYRTEVQLYCAMEAMLHCIKIEALENCQVNHVLEVLELMNDTELRFYKAFDMEIDDDRTIYRLCAKSLVPRSVEPGVCLLQDWLDIISA